MHNELYEGKTGIQIATRNYDSKHWSLEFLNRFDLLLVTSCDSLLGKTPLQKQCIKRGLEYKQSMNKQSLLTIDSINGKKVKYITTNKKYDGDYYIFTFYMADHGKGRYFDETDDYDVFIIHIEHFIDHFWIVSKAKMIEKGYVSTKTQEGNTYLKIALPNVETKHWSEAHWDRFDTFTTF